jgi:hypothetical protein
MATVNAPNYTEAQVEQLHNLYAELGSANLDKIAETLGKTVRSVRAKLVRDGLYVSPEKTATAKSTGASKKEILRDFETVGFDPTGLEGATKEALVRILNHIRVAN